MEGLARQVRLLHAALQPLGLEREDDADTSCSRTRALPEEVAAELHLALARATALAHWAAAAQQEELQHHQQTLASIAATLGASVAELRLWNPQLPTSLRDDAVLPPDTYLKVRAPAPPRLSPPPLPPPSPPPPLPAAPQPAPTASNGRTTGSASSSSSAPRARQSVPAPTPTVTGPLTIPAAQQQRPAATTSTPPAAAAPAPESATTAAATSRGDSVPTRRQTPSPSSAPASGGSLSGRSGTAARGGSATAGATRSGPGSGSGSLAVPRGSEGGASQGRYSVWTVGSGRGASASPPVPEPSMPQCGTDAAPPACAPPPMLMVRPSSPRYCYPPDGSDLIDLKEAGEGEEAEEHRAADTVLDDVSPLSEQRRPHAAHDAHDAAAAASLSSSAVLPVPPPLPGAAERSASRTSLPRRSSGGGGGGSVTSGRAIRTRGHTSHSRSTSPFEDGPVTGGSGLRAAIAPAANAAAAQPQAAQRAAAAGHGSPLRDASTTLSAVSPPSSMGDDRRSESGPRGAAGASQAGRTSSGEPRAAPASATAAAPTTRHTPLHSPKGRAPGGGTTGGAGAQGDFTTPVQQQRPRRGRQQGGNGPLSASGSVDAAAASATTPSSLSAARLSDDFDCSPVTPSTTSAGRRRGAGAVQGRTPYGETPGSYTGDGSAERVGIDEDEEEEVDRTPSTRPPALLGRHVCSPPPNLNRAARPPAQAPTSASNTTAVAAGAARRLVSPRTAHTVGGRSGPAMGASPLLDSTPSSPSPLPEAPPTRRGPAGDAGAAVVVEESSYSDTDDDGDDDELEEAELAGDEAADVETEDYDTLDGIAAAYNLSVATIVEWNPYLKKYRPSEPLPPDLPIVLPMSDADEEVEGDADGVEAREVTSQLLPPESRLGSREPDLAGYRGNATENSPVPHPPR